MHVVFTSNCESKALKKTRAIIDRYATRISDRSWASPFTSEALDEVHKALNRVATRQTSVSCYKNSGLNGLKLQWIVGNKNHYDQLGSYAIEIKSKKIEFPLYLKHAALLAQASGLGHDFGKANRKFANKLLSKEKTESDKVRHEWISAWLIRKMNGNFTVESLKEAWSAWGISGVREVVNTDLGNIWLPYQSVNTAYDALTFCVATHHKMLGYGHLKSSNPPDAHGNDMHTKSNFTQPEISECTIVDWGPWESIMDQLSKKHYRMNDVEGTPEYWRGVSLIARACLILADHEVSSIKYAKKSNTDTWANSKVDEKFKRSYNQPLTYHLDNVGKFAANNIMMFSGTDLPVISDETRARIESKVDDIEKYGWQDIAFEFLRDKVSNGPSLVFNVAGTGAGKTLGNVKILAALNPENLRITSGFNLRTLTLQTRDAYVSQVGLKNDEIGCIVGGANNIIEKIHEFSFDDDESRTEANEWNIQAKKREDLPDWLSNYNTNKDKDHCLKLIGSPVIVTTMDHIIEAGEPGKQAGHALAMIRVSSSDLIIDEADSYNPENLMAVLRVVEIAAMFGRNIVVSSATLPVVLADAISKAWRSGGKICQALKNTDTGHIFCISNKKLPVEINFNEFEKEYNAYVESMAIKLTTDNVNKIFRIVAPLNQLNATESFINRIITSVEGLHEANNQSYNKNNIKKTISIGLVRVANVNPCIQIARKLANINRTNPSAEIYVMTYHAKEILARRAWKEKGLDVILSRKPNNEGADVNWWEKSDEILKIVEKSDKNKVIFVVVATPVSEVGRDHDYDWAIIEPSSMTSIIQTSGRVNRHRLKNVTAPNIHILNNNWAYFNPTKYKNKTNCYTRPGHQVNLNNVKTHINKENGETMSVSEMFGMTLDKDNRTEPKEMNVGLIFGLNKKIQFSIEDDLGISNAIKGAIVAIGDQKSWLNGWIYDNFKLREKDNKDTFIYNFNDKKTRKVLISKSPKEINTKPRLNIASVLEVKDLSGKIFFSPNLNDIEIWIRNIEVSQNEKFPPQELDALGTFKINEVRGEIVITNFGIEVKE